jgi:hypothetical protein
MRTVPTRPYPITQAYINCILQRLENVGTTVSASKFVIVVPTTTIVGHKCTFEGCVPEESKVQKICDWPEPTNHTQVHGFLGTCGVLCIFIHNFLHIVRPLINLMKKDAPFIFGAEQCEAMQMLKNSVLSSPMLKCLDYAEGTKSDCGVRNQSLDVRSTTLLVRQYVRSCCA